jgi:hypothetical protein
MHCPHAPVSSLLGSHRSQRRNKHMMAALRRVRIMADPHSYPHSGFSDARNH